MLSDESIFGLMTEHLFQLWDHLDVENLP